ncbi:SDR family oxidoreductase [Ureibacillus sp. FSL K6-8385]|uniref:SDR family oxidoreductase n=1 Tax=Ureibacillus terrenus TaxID=118246 RepID=A0A540V3M0_9BACL|nr:SDR family oxidoreductase [Ureibacillus terrenus]MED3763175.1 SDR family oxidoreductase [Ureibacillus terrenus]TQE91321.1 SDR family oxidoreductase [Ureibacillus terrenus]
MAVHFFTGFPGFITRQLVREMFSANVADSVYVLVLKTEREKAEEVRRQLLEEYPGRTIEIFEGDITLPNLDLNEEAIEKIVQETQYFWHLAAIYDLAVPRDVAWKINVHGTSNVNDFVKTLPRLKRYMYFSTAYVAGRREGVILETELIRPDSFKNHYEETKFEAELLVNDLVDEIPLTIIRPGIVIGHSVTGETNKFDGPYFFLNLIDRISFLPFIPYIGKSTARINVVPVDYVAKAAIYLCQNEEASGKTVHLTDPNPHPVQEVYRTMVKEMTGKFPKGRIPLSFARAGLQMKSVRTMLGVEKETIDYLTWHADFDCSIALALLSKGNITCPDFLKIIPAMVRFYKEHKHNTQFQIPIK